MLASTAGVVIGTAKKKMSDPVTRPTAAVDLAGNARSAVATVHAGTYGHYMQIYADTCLHTQHVPTRGPASPARVCVCVCVCAVLCVCVCV